MPNVVRLVEDLPPHRLPSGLVEYAAELAACGVALYVVDIDGSLLRRIAGPESFPAEITIPRTPGPELPRERIGDVQRMVGRRLPGATVLPLWARDRAVGVLVCERVPANDLEPLTRQAAAAIELAERYTDVFARGRRRRQPTAAVELQDNLLAPRIAHLGAADLAAGIVPAYDVGGDWYDYAENSDAIWFGLADAVGKGPRASALAAVTLGALRAARRNQRDLDAVAHEIDRLVVEIGDQSSFVTALLGRWYPARRTLRWLSLGHPQPLLVDRDHGVRELSGPTNLPLGLLEHLPCLESAELSLRGDASVLLYSDGVTERRTTSGARFSLSGLRRAIETAAGTSPAALVSSIIAAVTSAHPDPPYDDATVLSLRPRSGG